MSDEDPQDAAASAAADSAMAGLPGARVVVRDADLLIDRLAKDMSLFAHRRVLEAGVFHLALSGGSTPQSLYRRMMIDPRYRLFPWRRTHLWIVDDRCVGPDDDRLNFKTIQELIVDHCEVDPAAAHPMPVLEQDGDRRYEAELRAALAGAGDRLDYVLLGMGTDGHTASLFPDTPAVEERGRWVVFNDGPTVAAPRPRMTMTYPIINAARRIAVLVTGTSKHAALARAASAFESGRADPRELPITGVAPADPNAELAWYLDQPAALGH